MTRIEELEQSIDETVEKFRLEINKHKAEIEKLKKEVALAELKESKKEGKWKPQLGEDYWFRNDEGSNVCRTYNGYVADTWRYNNVPMFKTQSECDRYYRFMDTVKEKSYEFSKEEWEDRSVTKYYIYYVPISNDFIITYELSQKNLGGIYFKTMADAQYIIDNFQDELMEYFL